MQLTCPTCGARYRIDASTWPTEPGPDGEAVHRARRARCKICRIVWNAIPEEELLELDDPLPPEQEQRLGDAAWASLGGWPDPKPLAPPPPPDFTPPLAQPPPVFTAPGYTPPGFTPPKDPLSPLYAPPARPAIHFESPPVPIPAIDARPMVRARLPGPGAAFGTDDIPDGSPHGDDLPPPPPPEEESWDDEDEDDDEGAKPRRWWLYALIGLALAAGLYLAIASGRLRTQDYGLPPVYLPTIELPQLAIPHIALDITMPQLPRTAPPPLSIKADAVKRRLPDNRLVWEVQGVITNPTQKRLPVPPVEVLLLDSGGRTVGRWTVRPDIRNLVPGGVARFETSTIDPPESAERLRLQLKPAELGRL